MDKLIMDAILDDTEDVILDPIHLESIIAPLLNCADISDDEGAQGPSTKSSIAKKRKLLAKENDDLKKKLLKLAEERAKELEELRRIIEKRNEIQAQRNELLRKVTEEKMKTSELLKQVEETFLRQNVS